MIVVFWILTPLCSISLALLARYAHYSENRLLLGLLACVVGAIVVAYLLLDDTTAMLLLMLGNVVGVFVPFKWNPLIRRDIGRSTK
jgi:hypothetical protein